MKLKAWANRNGVSYRAALAWFHAGTLPVPARQLPSGTILVDPQPLFGEPCPSCGRPMTSGESIEESTR